MHEPQNTLSRKIPVLPLEIIDGILREASKFEWWPMERAERQVLTAGTLVCKSWLPLARRLLYHSIIVEIRHTCTNPGTIGPKALLQKSHLLELARSLSVRLLDTSAATVRFFSASASGGSFGRLRIPNLFSLLAHMPRLRFLELTVHTAQKSIRPFKPHVLDRLSTLVPPIEALDVNDLGYFCYTFVYDLMGIWPKIQALRMKFSISRHRTLPLERPSTSLRELRLPANSFATEIEWLLPPPPPNERSSLLFLELPEIPKEELPVLSVHGPSVSSLTLTCQPTVEFAHLFTKLEELVIAGSFWRSPFLTFPRTLKHIMLRGHMYNSFIAEVVHVVTVLPDLRALSIPEYLTVHADMLQACETHKVEILIYSVNSSGRAVHPYHAEMDRFPRQFTFSEFFDIEDRRL